MNQRDDAYSIQALFFIIGVILLLAQPLSTSLVQAASPITSSGLNTQVSGPIAVGGQTQYNITGGTRPGGGTNLFHSFGDFNVPTSNIANFLNTPVNGTLPPTSNILGRVTGGNISNIFGTIQTTGFGNANLFLINPAGFLFGPNATVNVGGMVAFTSADYLRLADGARFNAIPNANADALLSMAPVAAFGFLGSNPGAITVQGSQLTVADGMGISLVGGNITVQGGSLTAPSGQINLVSLDKPSNPHAGGEVVVSGSGPSAGLVPTGFKSMGTIALTQGSTLDTSTAVTPFGASAGNVSIRGGQFVMDASAIAAVSKGFSFGQNGNVEVTANTVTLSNGSSIQIGMGSACCTTFAGNITVNAETFSATDSAISIITGGGVPRPYTPGAITIQGLNGAGSSAKLVTLTNSRLSAEGGQDGFVGGPITIQAKNVTLNQSFLDTFSVDNFGGSISVLADGQIQIIGGGLRSSSFFGPGGNVNLQAGNRINLTNAGISAFGSDGGGSVSLSAPSILVNGGSISAETTFHTFFPAGRIAIDAIKEVRITDGAKISADSPLSDGGNISIHAGGKVVVENSAISAQSAQGNGGTIQIQADHRIRLTDSQVTTSVSGGPGTVGGTITLDSNVVKLQNSQVLSTATEGQGGTINITTQRFRPDAASVIDASSQFGTDGTVTIQQP